MLIPLAPSTLPKSLIKLFVLIVSSKLSDASLNLGHAPRRGSLPDFHGRWVDPRLDPAIPCAFAHWDDFENLVQTQKSLVN